MTTAKTASPSRTDGQNRSSILAVDDNPMVLKLLTGVLEKEGYTVATATNGLEATAILGEAPEKFDVILLDRMMPEMGGMDVTRKILTDKVLKHIPIIMLTAADRPEQISEGIKAGVFYYLTKPIERQTLLSIVAAAVKEVKHRRTLRSEMRRHHISCGLIQVVKSSCKTIEEAESMASFLANCFPDPDRALTGLSELLINAVEHGNLAISYDEKTSLLNSNQWDEEIQRRLLLPENSLKEVTILFEKRRQAYSVRITDQGKGFNWRDFLEFDPSRASHNHGRGIAMANVIAFDQLRYNQQGNQVTAVVHIEHEEATDSEA